MMTEKSVTLLGATGSIGASTIDLIERNPGRYRVEAVTAARNVKALGALARKLGARFAAVADPSCYAELKSALAGSGIEAGAGDKAMVEAAERPADWVMAAITGAAGLKPTLAAVARGAAVAIANKECLVCAGSLFMRRAQEAGTTLLPVDSEHNAVFQALGSGRRQDLRRIILTASGGPFRTWSLERMREATLEQALRHPNWEMGKKVTIDSATMMNKGLELIEAFHLFALRPDQIDILVHPQSIVHSLVEFCDGSMIAQLGPPDMRVPIAHCLAWPERMEGAAPTLDLAQVATLTFEAPDTVRFPALRLARATLGQGGGATSAMNAANEVAVEAFLARRLAFARIIPLVEETLLETDRRGLLQEPQSIEDALSIDHISRSLARELLPQQDAEASLTVR
jgi:1-deoxy-D-xylulose-5-phosphate reductoisomerase